MGPLAEDNFSSAQAFGMIGYSENPFRQLLGRVCASKRRHSFQIAGVVYQGGLL